MRIVFLKAYDFPLGGAPQNRLLCICKGLIEQGHDVEVHQYAPAKLNIEQNHFEKQVYNTVKIFNHSYKYSPIKSRVQQLQGIITGVVKSWLHIFTSVKKRPIDYIFINNEKNSYLFIFYLLAKICNAKFGRDLVEYPLPVLKPDNFNDYIKKYKLKTNYRWFDVLFIISRNLIEFYQPYIKKGAKVLHLPVNVDFERFPNAMKELNSNYITYCGDLSQSKDGVIILIKAFSIIKDEFKDIHLKLIGFNNNEEYMNSLNQLISDLKINDRVIQTGYVHPEKIPDELYNSRILVLARPDNIQAKGGFPTKLGEYLATGVPVVVTDVGELTSYLEDGRNAFIAKPDSVEDFAMVMKRALSDKEFAFKVGIEGRKTALKYFCHLSQGKFISDFLMNSYK